VLDFIGDVVGEFFGVILEEFLGAVLSGEIAGLIWSEVSGWFGPEERVKVEGEFIFSEPNVRRAAPPGDQQT
jgi:hypothetical protein